MITLQAPYDLIQASIVLPSPSLGDYIAPQNKVSIRNSMNGKIYSTIKRHERYKIEFDVILTQAKARELDLFNEYYNGLFWRLYDWNDTLYRVILNTNPLSFTNSRKSHVSVRLEFEGTKIV